MSSQKNINSLLEALVNEIAKEVSERLMFAVEEQLENKFINAPKSQKLLIDSDELANQLSVSKSTIIKLRQQGMPTVYIGDSVRFEPMAAMHFINNLNHKENGKIK